jgi:L-threonylcarbamoyladenylate synthase
MDYKHAINKIKEGKIGVIPTDTIYGLVCSAFVPNSVEKIYKLKKRKSDKPLIILIASKDDLRKFGIHIDKSINKVLDKYWPGPVSITLPCKNKTFSYIHRGGETIAFRVPKPEWLRELILEAGPLVAPSANREGQPPAKSIRAAKQYFGDRVSFYIDGGKLDSEPSMIISLTNGEQRIR